MVRVLILALLLVVPASGGASTAIASADASGAQRNGDKSVAAVQKVIQMLQDILAKCKQEKMDEEVAFAKFYKFCEMEISQLKEDIEAGNLKADEHASEITSNTEQAKELGIKIKGLQGDVEQWKAEIDKANKDRAKEHELYLGEVKDYSESIDALERAIAVLQKENYDRPASAAVLLEVSDKESIPAKAREIVASFMTMMDPDYQAPEANAYEFQSVSIIEMLKKLLDDFRAKLGDAEKEELNAQHAHDMLVTDLTNSIAYATEDISIFLKTKSEKETKAAFHKEALGALLKDIEAMKKRLADLETECSQKKLSFDEKQRLRADEIAAIEEAIKIMSSESVSTGSQHLDLPQVASKTALLQISRRDQAENIHWRIREFIAGEGSRLHSQRLSLLAQKLAADPFAKVKKLIDDMITRLLEEANADAAREGWCDTEMGKSKVTRNQLNEEIDGLTAEIEEGKATIQALADEIALLTKQVADIEAAMTEATELREAEKAKNAQTIAEAKDAQEAVTAAIAVLKEFYERAGKATALLQYPKMGSEEWKSLANPNYEANTDTIDGVVKVDAGHQEGMQTFGETYKGKQDEAGGVLALMEVILSDFVNVEQETSAAEAIAQDEYVSFMRDSKQDIAVKTKKIEMDTADKAAAEAKLETDTKDLKATQDELLAAERYYEKLVPQCIEQGVTFEERTKQREEEIKSLREALKILSSADIETSA